MPDLFSKGFFETTNFIFWFLWTVQRISENVQWLYESKITSKTEYTISPQQQQMSNNNNENNPFTIKDHDLQSGF